MTFVQNNKSSSTMTQDSRTAVASLTQTAKSGFQATWGYDFKTWAQETGTWAAKVLNISQDARH